MRYFIRYQILDSPFDTAPREVALKTEKARESFILQQESVARLVGYEFKILKKWEEK